jgi:hypothetical protein
MLHLNCKIFKDYKRLTFTHCLNSFPGRCLKSYYPLTLPAVRQA